MSEASMAATDNLLSTVPPGIFDSYSVEKVIISVFMIACTIVTAVITHVILRRCQQNDDDDRSIRLFQFNAFANMVAGLSISTVFLMSDAPGNAPYAAVACQTCKTFIYIFTFQGTAFVTAITVNRFLHVKWPLQYYRIVSFKRMNVAIAMIVVISTVYSVYLPLPNFPYVEGLKPDCFTSPYHKSHQRIITLFLLVLWSVNHFIILGTNVLLLKITFDVRRSRSVATVTGIARPLGNATENVSREVHRGTNRSTKKRQHRGVILVISISVTYFVLCLPSMVVLSFIAAQSVFFSPYVYVGVFLLGIASSVWNIIAFVLFDTKFRRVICGMFRRTREQIEV